jgi:hypothetical protein
VVNPQAECGAPSQSYFGRDLGHHRSMMLLDSICHMKSLGVGADWIPIGLCAGRNSQPSGIIRRMRRWQINLGFVLIAALGLLVLVRCHH